MSQTELLHGYCPKCDEPLDVPAHLQEFSCLYCGARLSPAELKAAPTPITVTEESRQAAEYYRAHILETITAYTGIEKEVARNTFEAAFRRYRTGCAPTFRSLDEAVTGGAITLQDAVDYYLDELQARWEANKSWSKSINSQLEMDKFIIAIYLVPMVQDLKLSISEGYCKTLHETWMKRYPQFPFCIGTYEELSNGFNKKYLGLCFITTAVCRYSGKPDDCAELTAFRAFRDGYLRACPDGPALISKYYDIAPGIVLHLEQSSRRDDLYRTIRETYLEPCYADLQAGRLQACKERYTNMVLALEQEYLS